ncbi:RagB/SusD family nutrient uptake outer membrane protein [Flavisolibacter ginsenosidimutans]|uniref:RagB/SusD family nutrient uptake outer membrane protein n=1 Tax=Flavisolibacter ginsenosidimutans TaxID=661481 RepID=A0A5B8UI45_9BACT|nr:RagB/SusD family nutrient uptake outer membrane protein [Flavisolibacter ginsenosidimutans]QEC56102.1 RagB/SusD family nutrient uptake outer membrane protein [Flavisolibacter ginsenosidimutans]
MKKTYFIIITVALWAMSCKKSELNIANPNQPTTQQFWQTANDAQLGVNAIYSTYHRAGLSRWMHFLTIIRADEGFSTSPAPWIRNYYDLFNYENYNDGLITSLWYDCYTGINRCNQVLDNVPAINMDNTQKQQLLGEAKFMRGLFYYTLALHYGNVPVILHVPKPSEYYPSTTPQDGVYAQAAQDFTDATTALPATYDASNKGRATKGAAYAMLGKVYMQQRKWQQAKDALQWLAEGPGASNYNLVANYRDNFIETTENNSESVFEFQNAANPIDAFDNDAGDGDPNHTPDKLNYGTSIPPFFAPRPIGFTDGQAFRWVVWEFLKESQTNGQRDPRVAATFLYDSTDVRGPNFTLVYGQTWTSRAYSNDLNDPIAVATNRTVYWRKFLDDATMNGEVFHSGNNYRYLRYADVLLLYAEALNALGQTTQAYTFVDKVRVRAGLKTLTAAMPGLSQQAFLTQLKHERITELSGEGHRWEDLIRWGDLSASLSSKDPAFVNFKTGKNEVLPIPQFDLDNNPNLKQNPGY